MVIEYTTTKPYVDKANLDSFYTLSLIQVNISNLLPNRFISSSFTAPFDPKMSKRNQLIRQIKGKYSFVPTSSEDFAIRKQREIDLGR